MSTHAQDAAVVAPVVTAPPGRGAKVRMLAGLAITHPVEFFDRVRTIVECTRDRKNPCASNPGGTRGELISGVSKAMGKDLNSILEEPALREFEDKIAERQRELVSVATFPTYHNADFAVARMCYAVCRACRPATVLETGVGFGVTTAFILKALAANGGGELWSVDLPPLGRRADEQVGFLVPQDLRERWHLVRGSSRRVLPRVLKELGELDVFVHDSLHTYEHMIWEFQSAWPRLRKGGVVVSDNVDFNRAFEDFAAKTAPMGIFSAREENALGDQTAAYGIMVKGA